MSKRATSLRSQVEQVFHLTGALQVHLRILESARVPVEVRINPSPAGLAGGDIEALAFLVLMAVAKSAQEDLRAIMGKVKAINEAKKKVRTSLDKKRGARHSRPKATSCSGKLLPGGEAHRTKVVLGRSSDCAQPSLAVHSRFLE